jgi:hypothetical protein
MRLEGLFITSDIAEYGIAGDIGLEKEIESCKLLGTVTEEGVCGRGPPGLVEREVFIGMEEMDTRLPRDELFDKAEAGVLDIGSEVRTCCLGLDLTNEGF